MKFSTAFTAFIVVLPILSGQALAAAQGNKGNGKGSKAAPPPPAKSNAVSNNNASNNTASNNTASNNNAGNNDPQTSLTLDSSVINLGSEEDGSQNATAGQSLSITSKNNFINICIGKGITDGKQITSGSCNPIPMGDIPSTDNMPAARFASPPLGSDVAAKTTFDIVMNVQGMQDGVFTNAQSTYYAAPQQLNAAGQIIGHNHITCQSIPSFTSTAIPDPKVFQFFKGIDAPAVNGQLTATVTNGLAPGFYRCCSITTTANHVSVAVPVAQRGSIEDCTMFSVGQGNSANPFSGNGGNAANNGTASGNNAGNNSTATGNNTGNNSTVTGNNTGNNSTATGNNTGNSTNNANNGGNANNAGKKAGKNGANNAGKIGGNNNQGNKKAPGGRRRLVARLARDY